jgi:hypothetical protein
MKSSRFVVAAGTILAVSLGSSAGRADTPRDSAGAEALFAEGRRLMVAGDYAKACPTLANSEALDPAPGTALNLALCYEKMGKFASAWAAYRTAQATAETAHQSDRALVARKKAVQLESKVSRLTVTVPTPSPGLQVTCDGEIVQAPSWGIALPKDGGAHTIEARAPGKSPWSTRVDLAATGQSLVVEVARLEDVPAQAPAPPSEVATPAPAPAPLFPPAVAEPSRRPLWPLVYAGFGVAVAGLATGIVTGVSHLNKIASIKNEYCNGGTACTPGFESALDDARPTATVSTVAFVVAGAGVAAGIVGLLLPGKHGEDPSAASLTGGAVRWSPVVGFGSLGARGTF